MPVFKPGDKIVATQDTETWGGVQIAANTEVFAAESLFDSDSAYSAKHREHTLCIENPMGTVNPEHFKHAEEAAPEVKVAGSAVPIQGSSVLVRDVQLNTEVGPLDHQPAPAPEPEWKTGAVAHVETESWHGTAVRRGGVWNALDDGEAYAIDAYVTDVRPFVVLDVESEDLRDELTNAVSTGWVSGTTNGDIVERVLDVLRAAS